ncbi:MAG: hypothetical protein PHP20_03930 [Firmicutes bacterium]|nr:hypothetical protein [Bacillota bacterium]MDD4335961.1 hypothetical protein [Bacillota bacterium]MDD4792192.1 hypothetical protein [Bacillota bacterium]
MQKNIALMVLQRSGTLKMQICARVTQGLLVAGSTRRRVGSLSSGSAFFILAQAMAFELVPSEKTSDWLAVTKFFKMIAIAAMASVSGLIWDHVGPHHVFLLAVGIDADIRIPLLASVPETLQLSGHSGEAGVGG